MNLESYKFSAPYLPVKVKIKLLIVSILLTSGVFWLLSSWFDTLNSAYMLMPNVRLSIGGTLGGIIGLGLLIYSWSMFFTVIKTGRATKYSWSKRKIKVQNRIMLFFFIASFIVTALTYFIINDRLLSEGYSVKTKYTNMGIYKTYIKN
ncbi:hypothetical protein VAS14_02548 [Photobacterium angustum S14]|uniref:Uncharacterized protein n=1 Tax=Photobacterium angustum (strain S14 / CCUG 15956) TaxID=314292 RepID=Q1ZTD7_PHOAS|nr:hypothetical protein [Photobacterium angustum]EAS64559.1 hypothetical protein VAS14_02548 [Photobacterium angustum S14]